MKQNVLLIALSLAGCATPRPEVTLAQLDAALAENKAASARFYRGKTADEVRAAAQRVLYLLDPADVKFDVRANELLATRFSTYYAVFSFGFGRDWYSVTLTPEKDGTHAAIGIYGEMLSGLPSPIPESFRSNIPISAHDNPADFKLFHDRAEHILKLRTEWITCPMAKAAQTNPSKSMLLCDQIGLENLAPKQNR
jgi:hypothetical protein